MRNNTIAWRCRKGRAYGILSSLVSSVTGVGGITYLGWNVALDIPVAIKEYLPVDLATRELDLSVVPQTTQAASDFQWGLERFLDEARALARFQHPNIVRVHHFFEAPGTAYIAMDYVEGKDLSVYLSHKGTLQEAELTASCIHYWVP